MAEQNKSGLHYETTCYTTSRLRSSTHTLRAQNNTRTHNVDAVASNAFVCAWQRLQGVECWTHACDLDWTGLDWMKAIKSRIIETPYETKNNMIKQGHGYFFYHRHAHEFWSAHDEDAKRKWQIEYDRIRTMAIKTDEKKWVAALRLVVVASVDTMQAMWRDTRCDRKLSCGRH